MKTVKHILAQKNAAVYAAAADTSVFDALHIMMEKNISALLIIEQGTLLGIFTERDYARKIILQGKSSKETAIGEVMTPQPRTITEDESLEHCMQLMTDHHFRHLPVVQGDKVIGMLSIGDVVKFIIEDQRQTIDHLKSYISS